MSLSSSCTSFPSPLVSPFPSVSLSAAGTADSVFSLHSVSSADQIDNDCTDIVINLPIVVAAKDGSVNASIALVNANFTDFPANQRLRRRRQLLALRHSIQRTNVSAAAQPTNDDARDAEFDRLVAKRNADLARLDQERDAEWACLLDEMNDADEHVLADIVHSLDQHAANPDSIIAINVNIPRTPAPCACISLDIALDSDVTSDFDSSASSSSSSSSLFEHAVTDVSTDESSVSDSVSVSTPDLGIARSGSFLLSFLLDAAEKAGYSTDVDKQALAKALVSAASILVAAEEPEPIVVAEKVICT